jgi:hypothetical protein
MQLYLLVASPISEYPRPVSPVLLWKLVSTTTLWLVPAFENTGTVPEPLSLMHTFQD